jgi:hypothetical protein
VSRPRRVPLPAPFDKAKFRHEACALADVCEVTLLKWVAGDQNLDPTKCRSMVEACARLGALPPLGAKLSPMGAAAVAVTSSLRAVS